MRLGGFVIHGNAADTLAPCLEGLLAVCDEVVCVDSGSSDGSAEISARLGVKRVERPWKGYGSARAAAVEALPGCDYLLFLDSDERLGDGAIAALRRWRESGPSAPYYSIPVRDWAELPGRRFVYRVERHVRIVRADHAVWTPAMIVHEALPPAQTEVLDRVVVEHRFATSIAARAGKEKSYALLWAVRNADGPRRGKPAWTQRVWHVVRDCVVKGALWRGGVTAVRLAWAVSRYHALKYEFLADLRRGGHESLVDAFRAGRYEDVFRSV